MAKGDRLEYIKQPHIMVLIVVVSAVVIGALYTGIVRVMDSRRLANSDTSSACMEFVNDEALCSFAASNEASGSKNYVINSTTTNGPTTEVSTIEVENADRMKSVTLNGLTEVESYVVIDSKTFVKDYSDNTWAVYDDPEFTSSESSIKYDFTSETSKDVKEFRENYESQGQESCDELNCYKYKVSGGNENETTYVWFDDKDFLLRRYMTITTEATTNNQFEYREVKIKEPSPTKQVSQEELGSFLNNQGD